MVKKRPERVQGYIYKILNEYLQDVRGVWENAPMAIDCFRCGGLGKVESVLNKSEYPCPICGGIGRFHRPDLEWILKEVLSFQGVNKGKLKIICPQATEDPSYYVWRVAAYIAQHTKNCFNPIKAEMYFAFHPYKDHLKFLAEKLAEYHLKA